MHLRASPSIRDSADRVWVIGPSKLRRDIWVREFNRGRRMHFEVDVTTRTRNESCDKQQAAQTPIRRLSFRFICPYPLSLACSVKPTKMHHLYKNMQKAIQDTIDCLLGIISISGLSYSVSLLSPKVSLASKSLTISSFLSLFLRASLASKSLIISSFLSL